MRSVRLRLAVALGGVATVALSMFSSLALPESATADPLADSDGSVTAISLENYFVGEPSWPSTMYPSFALRIELAEAAPVSGDTVDIDLSENLSAAAAPGSILDAQGTELATYQVSADSHRISVTYTEAAASVVDLEASLAVFVSSDSLVPGGSTVSAEATVGATVFPLSASYTGLAWSENGVVGTWATSPSDSLRFLARPVVEARPEYATEGGQWIGVGAAEGWPGALAPVSGTTRVFALAALPADLAGFTAQSAALVEGVDYTLDEQASTDGQPVFGISIASPTSGYIVVEQTYDVVSTGPALLEAPNATLPTAARQVFGGGTRIVSGTVNDHAQGSNGIGGISGLTFFASSGGTASATAMAPAISAERAMTPTTAPPGEAKGTVSVTLTNTGNTPLEVTYTDKVTATASRVTVRDVTSDSGTASADADTVSWTGRLAPGAQATVSYAYGARATGAQVGALVFSGTARGAASSNPLVTTAAEIADAEVSVSALPAETDGSTPAPSSPPAASNPPAGGRALASTGADGSSHTALTALALVLSASGILALASRRRVRS